MSQRSASNLSFQTLYASPLARVVDYQCHACQSGPASEEQCAENQIVLMRNGTFRQHFGARSVIATVNQSVFFTKNSVYRVSHPADCGDRGTVLTTSPRVLTDIVRELDPSVDDHPDNPFPFVIGPCDNKIFLRYRELVCRLENIATAPLEPLWAEVTTLQLMADVLALTFARYDLPQPQKRSGTQNDHAERVEAVKTFLAANLQQRFTLDDIARTVGASPFHLARMFQQHTGTPIHRYLLQLRLREALERLVDGADALTALALDLGFSSHSHFTDSFRREFGYSPSAVRRAAPTKLRKILEA